MGISQSYMEILPNIIYCSSHLILTWSLGVEPVNTNGNQTPYGLLMHTTEDALLCHTITYVIKG